MTTVPRPHSAEIPATEPGVSRRVELADVRSQLRQVNQPSQTRKIEVAAGGAADREDGDRQATERQRYEQGHRHELGQTFAAARSWL